MVAPPTNQQKERNLMGLDMYLQGEAFYTHGHPNRKATPLEIEKTIYRLAYWRKHPNLHGFIVKTFADGGGRVPKNRVRR